MADIEGFGEIFAEIDNMTKEMEDRSVVAGFVEGAEYSDGTPIAQVAATQNFGNGKIPPRPFMTKAIEENEDEWLEELGDALKSGQSVDKALTTIGLLMQADIKQAIIDTNEPPLALLTLLIRKIKRDRHLVGMPTTPEILMEARHALRGDDVIDLEGVSDKPLVDSGTMLNHVDFQVK